MAAAATQPSSIRFYWAWRKWRALVGMFVQDGLDYKANMVIWVMTDVVTAVTMPLIRPVSYLM